MCLIGPVESVCEAAERLAAERLRNPPAEGGSALNLQEELDWGMQYERRQRMYIDEILTPAAQARFAAMLSNVAYRAAMRPSNQEAANIIPAHFFWHLLSAPYCYSGPEISPDELDAAVQYWCLDHLVQPIFPLS